MVVPLSRSVLVLLSIGVLPLLALRGQLEFGPHFHPGLPHPRGFHPELPHRSLEAYVRQLRLDRRELIRENAFLVSYLRQFRDGGHGFNDFNEGFGNRGSVGFDFGSRFFGEPVTSNYPEWFETTKDDLTCKDVPAVVNAGRPPGDVCLASKASEKRCICVKNQGSRLGDYTAVCGQCRDACGLRFTPEGGFKGFLEELVKRNVTITDDKDEKNLDEDAELL